MYGPLAGLAQPIHGVGVRDESLFYFNMYINLELDSYFIRLIQRKLERTVSRDPPTPLVVGKEWSVTSIVFRAYPSRRRFFRPLSHCLAVCCWLLEIVRYVIVIRVDESGIFFIDNIEIP